MPFRHTLAALLAITLCLPLAAVTAAKPAPKAEIEALRDNQGQIHCTVFPINEPEHLWMTALHCVVSIDEYGRPNGATYEAYINGEQVHPYKYFPESGVAIVYTPRQHPTAFKLAKQELLGEAIEIDGHGLGLETTTKFKGRVAVVSVQLWDGLFYSFYDMAGCHGHSGTPVQDAKSGEVIGVMQVLLADGVCGAPTGGTTLADLTRDTVQYWQH